MRALASIRKISDIQPIPNADAIVVASVDGWKVVIRKDEFQIGDLAIYVEIDSWVPTELAPFLSKGHEPRKYNDVAGERLRTIKLRKQVSQGLLLPASIIESKVEEGQDVTELLNIQKWERPLPSQMQGVGTTFPSCIPRTNQERVQNLSVDYFIHDTWETSIKLDGSSMTVFINNNEENEDVFGVCSRNWLLTDNEENAHNTFIRMANKLNYVSILQTVKDVLGFNFAVQGEIMGPGIQGNRETLDEIEFFVFDIYNIDEARYLLPNERMQVVNILGWDHVPILNKNIALASMSIDDIIELANKQKSLNHQIAEGIVFKSTTTQNNSFKSISTRFLLKGGD
jgi:RNA ligase (TIGR02306 family)